MNWTGSASFGFKKNFLESSDPNLKNIEDFLHIDVSGFKTSFVRPLKYKRREVFI